MGAGAIGAICLSALINGNIILRDATHGPIAGAIAVGASSLYITNPVYAFVAGAAGGILQTLIQNFI
jgi:ammonia channel protein AmtB